MWSRQTEITSLNAESGSSSFTKPVIGVVFGVISKHSRRVSPPHLRKAQSWRHSHGPIPHCSNGTTFENLFASKISRRWAWSEWKRSHHSKKTYFIHFLKSPEDSIECTGGGLLLPVGRGTAWACGALMTHLGMTWIFKFWKTCVSSLRTGSVSGLIRISRS